MENMSQHDIGFLNVTVKVEEEEKLNESELDRFSKANSGFPEVEVKEEEVGPYSQASMDGTSVGYEQSGFPEVSVKPEEEEGPYNQGFQERPGDESGYPGIGIKLEEEDEMDYQGPDQKASFGGDPSAAFDIFVKSEEKEGMDHQGSMENISTAGGQPGVPNLFVKPEEEEKVYNQGSEESTSPGDNQTGFVDIVVKTKEEESLYHQGSVEMASVDRDPSGFPAPDIKLEEEEGPHDQGPEGSGGVAGDHSVTEAMAPKKAPEGGKRKKEMILLEVKKEIIRKHEAGMRVTDLAREYGKNASTIASILKMKERIAGRAAAKGVTMITKHRPPVLEEVEKLLLLWIQRKERAGDTVSEAVVCEKARALHTNLLARQPSASAEAEEFKASRGWLENFKARSGIHCVVRHGEAVNAVVPAAEDFATEFLEVVVSGGYLPQQVFNCDETGLFWKRMPKQTIKQEGTKLPGRKRMKDRLALLLCANASGDLKIKPLLVYHLENPRAFRKHKVDKEQLGVLWRSSSKAWVTRALFAEWVHQVLGPTIQRYLVDMNLPLKAVLLVDNAPAHHPGLEGGLAEEFNFIKVMFLPPNTTPLLQPMDQQVIANFKKLYTRELFRRCLDMTCGLGITLREYWRHHFDIVSCLQLIQVAWDGVSQRDLNAAWRNLWPDCVVSPDSSAPESAVVQEIVSLGRTMGLEVTEEDICELVEGHDRDLTIQDLMDLHQEVMEEQQVSLEEEQEQEEEKEEEEEEEEEEEPREEQIPSAVLKEACQLWGKLQTLINQHHPHPAESQRWLDGFDAHVMSPLRGLLKRRQREQTMDRFPVKQPRHALMLPSCPLPAPLPKNDGVV